jgi:phosphoribosylglycinamide formyltransferase 1
VIPLPVPTVVLASGAGSNLGALLEARRADPEPAWTPALVLSDREGSGALELARAEGIPTAVVPPGDDHETRLLATLDAANAGLLVLAGYLRLVPASVVARWRGRILNVHPSLLPAFGGPGMYGRRVHEAVLAAGVRVSGATVHLVDERFDEGPILAQWPVPVEPGDDAPALAARILETEHRLYPAVVAQVARALARGEDPASPLSASRLPSSGLRFP